MPTKFNLLLALGLSSLVAAPLSAAATKPVAKPAAKPAATADAKPAATAAPTAAPTTAPTPAPTPSPKPTEEAKKEEEKAEVKHKSPGLAGGLAFFPGLIVHGSGHMYAGSWMKGLGLFAIELGALSAAYDQYLSTMNDVDKISKGMDGGKFPTSLGPAFRTVGIGTVSLFAFLWTWWDDMAGAPIAANEYNRLADEKAQASLQLLPRANGVVLALSTDF